MTVEEYLAARERRMRELELENADAPLEPEDKVQTSRPPGMWGRAVRGVNGEEEMMFGSVRALAKWGGVCVASAFNWIKRGTVREGWVFRYADGLPVRGYRPKCKTKRKTKRKTRAKGDGGGAV